MGEVGRRLRAAHPGGTAETYLAGWEAWASWARRNEACALPADPGEVAAHLSGLAAEGRSVNTVKVRRAAIRAAHRAAGLEDPGRAEEVAKELDRITAAGAAPRRPAAVGAAAVWRAAELAAGEGSPAAKRDAAILELLSSGWLRPGELVRLDWADLTAPSAGRPAAVAVRGADGGEEPLEVPPAAWRRLREWRRAAGGPDAGPMFTRLGASGSARLGPRDLRRIVARRLAAAGVAGATPSGLRAGAAVAAFQQGASLPEVLRRGRWSDARRPAEYAAAAEAAADEQRPAAGEPTAGAATAAYLAAEADALAALDRLRGALEALQQAVGPRQAARVASLPARVLQHCRSEPPSPS